MADDPRETPAQHIEMQAETGVIEHQGAATQDPQPPPTPVTESVPSETPPTKDQTPLATATSDPQTPVKDQTPPAEATSDPQAPAAGPTAPVPPESELDKMEDKVEEVVKEVEALTEADVKAAFRWLLATVPAPLRDAFYKHHPKFQP